MAMNERAAMRIAARFVLMDHGAMGKIAEGIL
jgi:hypothetical protein